ncbi:DUF2017 domain-containing protein [Glaciihabitans sp. dw_435]|uniref:DUF2017 domain-containing protein n=1 Tax=Glaciihabitans sp. dw_435 TaxID=2720081 RepID=UPI001BD22FB7|nr:DUF2017 domain-containing protein [Glaciihabitans sp. dw_435]
MSGFSRSRSGDVTGTFSVDEARIIRDLAGQISGLLTDRVTHGSDPALDRLLPDAYRDNDDNAAEFRRFTEDDLAERKVRNAGVVVLSLDVAPKRKRVSIEVDDPGVQSWLRTLTDIRLTLGSRLNTVDEAPRTPQDENEEIMLSIYDWLGYVQETLIRAIDV